jgi:hypothetical protein
MPNRIGRMQNNQTTTGIGSAPSREPVEPSSSLERAASRFRALPAAAPVALVTLVSLTEERTLTLQGEPPEAPAAALCLWVDDLLASAEGGADDTGWVEEVCPDQGWVVTWSRSAGLAAVIAQHLDSPADLVALRAAGQTFERLF